MDITENKLQQLIIEELKEVLGMDQEYTGSEMDVDAENDLAGALMSLAQGETTGAGDDDDDPGEYVTTSENCGCPSCPEHGSAAKIRVKFR